MSTDLRAKQDPEHFELVMQVGEEFAKGSNYKTIATQLDLEPREARKMIEEYKSVVAWAAKNEMNVIDRLNLVVEEVDRHYQLLIKEAWANKSNAEMAEQYGTVNQSLKLVADIQKQRAAMFQHMNDGQDAELIAELEDTQRKQDQLIKILRNLHEKFPQAAAYIKEMLARVEDEPVEVEVLDN